MTKCSRTSRSGCKRERAFEKQRARPEQSTVVGHQRRRNRADLLADPALVYVRSDGGHDTGCLIAELRWKNGGFQYWPLRNMTSARFSPMAFTLRRILSTARLRDWFFFDLQYFGSTRGVEASPILQPIARRSIMRIRTSRELGAVLRNQRQALALSQVALSEKARVSRKWIVEIEKGKARAELGDRSGGAMPCNKCASTRQQEFQGELTVAFPGKERLNLPPVYI
jgi:hypothetical protein